MDRGAWWTTVHGVAKRRTRLWLKLLLHFSLVFAPSRIGVLLVLKKGRILTVS